MMKRKIAIAATLMLSALALTACNEQGSKGAKSAGKSAELNCPELPVDSTATGEFRDKRRTHWKMDVPAMATCEHCGATKRPHRVCPVCGYYNGVEVVDMKGAEA